MKGICFSCAAQAAPLGSKGQIQKQENPMQQTERKPLFDLGQLVATPGALAALEKTGQNAMEFLSRHVTGDWGEIPEEDKKEIQNEYRSGNKRKQLSLPRCPPFRTFPFTAFRNPKPIQDEPLMKRNLRNLRRTSASTASCSPSSSVLCRAARMDSSNSWPELGATALRNSPNGRPFPRASANSPTRNASNCNSSIYLELATLFFVASGSTRRLHVNDVWSLRSVEPQLPCIILQTPTNDSQWPKAVNGGRTYCLIR